MSTGAIPGQLFLVPNTLGDAEPGDYLPPPVLQTIGTLRYWIAENPKNARQLLKRCGITVPLNTIRIEKLDEHTSAARLPELLQPLLAGQDAGLVSDAGCPAVADPGANLVALAHRLGIRVRPLTGPSSLLLALMACGLGGQRFAFHGYLPVDEKQLVEKLRSLEKSARAQQQTQIFIETPYRNTRMLRILASTLGEQTRLCTATDVSLATEQISMRTIRAWRSAPAIEGFDNRPTVFLIAA